MKIFLCGISCIGKTSIGKHLADRINFEFFDLDREIEEYFGQSIEKLKTQHLTEYSFRASKGSIVLKHIIVNKQNTNIIIALPPSGLMDSYYRTLKTVECIIIILVDKAENILKRIDFYDADSNKIEKKLTEEDKKYYLGEIKKDMRYFGRTYHRAHLKIDIAGLDVENSVSKIRQLLNMGKEEEI
jgi:shikimate kinase